MKKIQNSFLFYNPLHKQYLSQKYQRSLQVTNFPKERVREKSLGHLETALFLLYQYNASGFLVLGYFSASV